MRSYRLPLAALSIMCCALVACGDDKPAASDATTASAGTTAGASTLPAQDLGSGELNCDELKTTLAGLTANWQVVIGLVNVPTSEWDTLPLGDITKFGDQIATVDAALGKNSQAAGALDYMSGANDIVVRGLGGDTTAQKDLADYLGPDASVNVNKQIPIALAYQNAGCS